MEIERLDELCEQFNPDCCGLSITGERHGLYDRCENAVWDPTQEEVISIPVAIAQERQRIVHLRWLPEMLRYHWHQGHNGFKEQVSREAKVCYSVR